MVIYLWHCGYLQKPFSCTKPVFKPDLIWIQLNTQKGKDTKCPPVNRTAYANWPVSHKNTKCIYVYITWYEWLDKSQWHHVLSIWSRSDLPSPLELAGDCVLTRTPLEGGNTLQTQWGPLKLLVEHGKVWDLDSVRRSGEHQSNLCLQVPICLCSCS